MPAGLISRWVGYWVRGFPDPGQAPKCKTQNSSLRSKEEKLRDPINQPSRRNKQEDLLSVAQTGDCDLLRGRAPRTANWASFLYAKKYIYILSAYYIQATKWLVARLQSNPIGTNFAGYMFTKQSYWHKLRGFWFKLKAILLVQMAQAFVQTQAPAGFSALPRAFTGCILIGWLQVIQWGQGILPFQRKPKPKSQPHASPSPGSPT